MDCAGIESPGLTSCPAIGRMVAGILKDKMGLEPNPDFVGTRKGILDPDTLTKEERAKLIQEKPAYGNIICRCEMVTEGEILDANPPGPLAPAHWTASSAGPGREWAAARRGSAPPDPWNCFTVSWDFP